MTVINFPAEASKAKASPESFEPSPPDPAHPELIAILTARLDIAASNIIFAINEAPTSGARLTRDEQAWLLDVADRLVAISSREDVRAFPKAAEQQS